MVDEGKISVVVPVYNVEDYLDRCVKSIISQTYENLEVILVDDGSSDGSPVMCDSWAQRIRVSRLYISQTAVFHRQEMRL